MEGHEKKPSYYLIGTTKEGTESCISILYKISELLHTELQMCFCLFSTGNINPCCSTAITQASVAHLLCLLLRYAWLNLTERLLARALWPQLRCCLDQARTSLALWTSGMPCHAHACTCMICSKAEGAGRLLVQPGGAQHVCEGFYLLTGSARVCQQFRQAIIYCMN